jgi:urease subunit gamma
VHLSPQEQERLLLSYAAELARRRRARGLRLNLPEATAIVADHVLEGARDGVLVAELMQSGRTVLTRDDVMDGVPALLEEAAWSAPCRVPPRAREWRGAGGPLTRRAVARRAGGRARAGRGGFGHGASPVRFPDTGCPTHRVPE